MKESGVLTRSPFEISLPLFGRAYEEHAAYFAHRMLRNRNINIFSFQYNSRGRKPGKYKMYGGLGDVLYTCRILWRYFGGKLDRVFELETSKIPCIVGKYRLNLRKESMTRHAQRFV